MHRIQTAKNLSLGLLLMGLWDIPNCHQNCSCPNSNMSNSKMLRLCFVLNHFCYHEFCVTHPDVIDKDSPALAGI